MEGNTFDSKNGSFDLTDCGLEPISCLGMSSVDETTYSGNEHSPSAAPPVYTGSKVSETVNLKVNTAST